MLNDGVLLSILGFWQLMGYIFSTQDQISQHLS
jgi:hypothetical protein